MNNVTVADCELILAVTARTEKQFAVCLRAIGILSACMHIRHATDSFNTCVPSFIYSMCQNGYLCTFRVLIIS